MVGGYSPSGEVVGNLPSVELVVESDLDRVLCKSHGPERGDLGADTGDTGDQEVSLLEVEAVREDKRGNSRRSIDL